MDYVDNVDDDTIVDINVSFCINDDNDNENDDDDITLEFGVDTTAVDNSILDDNYNVMDDNNIVTINDLSIDDSYNSDDVI
jgi:hypothetical protein